MFAGKTGVFCAPRPAQMRKNARIALRTNPPPPYLPRRAPLGPGRPNIPARPVSPAPPINRLAQSALDRASGPGPRTGPAANRIDLSIRFPLPRIARAYTKSPLLILCIGMGKIPLILHTFSRPFPPVFRVQKKRPDAPDPERKDRKYGETALLSFFSMSKLFRVFTKSFPLSRLPFRAHAQEPANGLFKGFFHYLPGVQVPLSLRTRPRKRPILRDFRGLFFCHIVPGTGYCAVPISSTRSRASARSRARLRSLW